MNLQRQTNFSVSSVGVPIRNTADYSPFGVQLDGRTIQGDFYRRGFNGMEKDDEVKGGGNSYTTEFRQYDARLGRWLSIDPVIKEHRSPYDGFNNNPIIFIDPHGDDDYYNADGSYNARLSKIHKKDGNNIYVISVNGKTKTLLYDMPLKTAHDIEIVEKIIKVYANQLGIEFENGMKNIGKGKLEIKSKGSPSNPTGPDGSGGAVLAFTTGKDIFINIAAGKISKFMSNYHQLKSVLYHESLHKAGRRGEGLVHAEVYLSQFQQLDFKRSTEDFQNAQYNGLGAHIKEAYEMSFTPNHQDVFDFIDKVNSKPEVYGIKITAKENNHMGVSETTLDINVTAIKTKKK